MNTLENNLTGRKVSIISLQSQMKALAAVYLCYCHEHCGMNLNNKTKPAVRPALEPHSQVPNTLSKERSKSALQCSNIPLPNFQLFYSRSAFVAPFWAIAKATWFWQAGKDMIRLKVLSQIRYSVGCLQETFVFKVLEQLGELKRW